MRLPLACLLPFVVAAPPAAARQTDHAFLELACGPESDRPVQAAWTPDGSALMVVHRATGDVTFLGPTFETSVPVGNGPLDLELVPSGQFALVPNSLDDTLSVLDVAARTVVASVPLSGSFPYQVEVASSGAFAVVACAGDSLSVVDLATLTETASWPTADQGTFPHSPGQPVQYAPIEAFPEMDLGPDDRTLALPCAPANVVEVYDVTSGVRIADSPLGFGIPTAAIVGGGSRYVGIVALDPSVFVLDTLTNQTRSYYPCSLGCFWYPTEQSLALAPSGTAMIAASEGLLLVLDLASALPLWDAPSGGPTLALSHDGQFALTAANLGGIGLVLTDLATGSPIARHPGVTVDRVVPHPSLHRVALLDTERSETVDWFDYGPAGIQHLRTTSTGPEPEADGPCRVATDASGERLVSANYRSNGVTIVDRRSGAVACVPTGLRPSGVAVDAAGAVAVVGHGDGSVAVLDLEAAEVVAELEGLYSLGLLIEPDGHQAYALDVLEGELSVIALDGAASHVAATLPVSGLQWLDSLALGDGLLAVLQPNLSSVALVDTATHALIQEVDTKHTCGAAVFAPDGPYLYVATHSHVRKFEIDGATSKQVGQAKVLNADLLAVSDDGAWVFVTTDYVNPPRFVVIDAATMTVVSEATSGGLIDHLATAGEEAFVYRRLVQQIHHMRFEGGLATLVEAIDPSSRPLQLLTAPDGTLYAVPDLFDGLDAYDYSGSLPYCAEAVPNSTGRTATLRSSGWPGAGLPLRLVADALPPGEPALFLVGDARVSVPFAGGGQGTLCVGGNAFRFHGEQPAADATGRVTALVDTLALAGHVVVQPGEVWHFQTLFRDHAPTATTNFSDAVSVVFP